ncbi:NAD(P)-binding protein [Jackrogersella minutella]|nr:NAD(P)-binding protein [Jackrogersella minutella]
MADKQRIFVLGPNRGIGFQLASRLQVLGHTVYGTCRPQTRDDPSVAEVRLHFAGLRKGIKTFEVDATNESSINRAAEDFGDGPLDVLVNVAEVYQLWDEKLFTEQSAHDLMSYFQVNVVVRTKSPVRRSRLVYRVSDEGFPGIGIINISSDMASIEDNTGGNACYCISKAGVNQLTKTMSIDLIKFLDSRVKTLAVHPGYVATKMTGFCGEDDMDTCMSSLADTILRFRTPVGPELPNGEYVRWNGEKMAY